MGGSTEREQRGWQDTISTSSVIEESDGGDQEWQERGMHEEVMLRLKDAGGGENQ